MSDDTKAGMPSPLGESGNTWNSGKVKLYLIAGVVVFVGGAYWLYSMRDDGKDKAKSSGHEKVAKSKEAGSKVFGGQTNPGANTGNVTSKTPDQPLGDEAAKKKLAEYQKMLEDEERAQKEAEEAARQQAEYMHYQRKLQGLPHNAELAAAWLKRLQDAAKTGQALAGPEEIKPEGVRILEKKNPQMLAAARDPSVSIKGGAAAGAVPGKQPGAAVAVGGGPVGAPGVGPAGGGKATVGFGGVPGGGAVAPGTTVSIEGIDPKTGLPTGESAEVAGVQSIYSLLPDGSPDIDRGSMPVTITFTPPGQTQPVTVVRWVKPGYLIGRVRPYDPKQVEEEDKMFRVSVKADTETRPVETYKDSRVPWRMSPSVKRVPTSNDVRHSDRYVVVVPNPNVKDSNKK